MHFFPHSHNALQEIVILLDVIIHSGKQLLQLINDILE